MGALGASAASLLVLVAATLPPSLAQTAMTYSFAPGSEAEQAAFLGEVWPVFPEVIEPSATASMACGIPSVSSYFTIHIAAMNLTTHPKACSRCIHLTCAGYGESCNGTSQGVTVAVVHGCPDCGAGDVQVNTFAFRELTGMEPGGTPAVLAHWSFVPCDVFGSVAGPAEDGSLLQPAQDGVYFQDVIPAAGPGSEPLAARQPAGPVNTVPLTGGLAPAVETARPVQRGMPPLPLQPTGTWSSVAATDEDVGAIPGRPPSVEAFIAQLPPATAPAPLPSLIELPQRAMDLPPAVQFPGDGGERGPAPEALQAPGAIPVQTLLQGGRSTAASIVSDGGTRGAVGMGGAPSSDPDNAPASPGLPVVVGLGQVNAVGSRQPGAMGVFAPGPKLLPPSLEATLLPNPPSPSPPGLPGQSAMLPPSPPASPALPPALLALVTPPAAEVGLPVFSRPVLPPTPEGSLIPQLSFITAASFGGPPAAEAAAPAAASPASPLPPAGPPPAVRPVLAAPRPELATAAVVAAPRPEAPVGLLPAAVPAAEVTTAVSLPAPASEAALLPAVSPPAAELATGAPTRPPVAALPPSPEAPLPPVIPSLSPSPGASPAAISPAAEVLPPAMIPPAPTPQAEVIVPSVAPPAAEAAPTPQVTPAAVVAPAAEAAPTNVTQPANETVPAAEGAPVVPQAPPSPELAPAVEAAPVAVPSAEATGPGPVPEAPAGAAAAAAPAPSPEAAVPAALVVPPAAASPGRPSVQPLTLFEERFFDLTPAPLVIATSPAPAPAPAAAIVPALAGPGPAPEGVVLPPAAEALLPPRTPPALQQPSPTAEQPPALQPSPSAEQVPVPPATGAQAGAPAAELAPARAAAAPTAEGAPAETFTGLATVGYSGPLTADKAKSLACSLGFLGSYAQNHFVGLDLVEVEDGLACGRCISMTGSNNRSVVAHVVDSCWGCAPEDVRINPTLYRELTGQNASGQASTEVTYTFVPCAQTVSGPIYMHVIPGGNQYYQQLTFSNSAEPLERMAANGQELSYTDFHRWVWFNGGNPLNSSYGPIHLTLTSQNGTMLSATAPGLYSQQLPAGVQFPGATPLPSPAPAAPPACTDTPPNSRYTCEQQKGWGKCDAGFMLAGNHCAATCGRCGGGTVAAG